MVELRGGGEEATPQLLAAEGAPPLHDLPPAPVEDSVEIHAWGGGLAILVLAELTHAHCTMHSDIGAENKEIEVSLSVAGAERFWPRLLSFAGELTRQTRSQAEPGERRRRMTRNRRAPHSSPRFSMPT